MRLVEPRSHAIGPYPQIHWKLPFRYTCYHIVGFSICGVIEHFYDIFQIYILRSYDKE